MIANDVLIRRAEVVRVHLDILDALLREPLGASQAIRASMSLRFLFDGPLNRAAFEARQPLLVTVPDVAGAPIEQALVFACGGYTIGGNEFSAYYAYRKPGEKSPYRRQFEEQAAASPRILPLAAVKLGSFQQAACLAIMGEVYSRDAVIRYVANKCGGAHHHDDTAKFDAIEHGITSVGHGLELGGDGLSAVFLETLGTAYFLLASPDVSSLRAKLATPAP